MRTLPWVLAAALLLPGCAVVGLGAAAVGGCSLLDRDDDERVSRAELSAGLFTAWDTNRNGTLSRAEFDAGTGDRELYADWRGDFDEWDDDDDGALTRAEFEAGVEADENTEAWLDRRCDDLGL